MKEDSASNRRFACVVLAVTGLASLVTLIAMVLTGIEKVRSGHGLDTYRTFWLVEFNWIAFLVLIAAVAITLPVAGFLHYLEWRELRELQRRYGGKDRG